MAPLIGILASAGIDLVTNLIKDNGEDLVKEGIKKVTGINLKDREPTVAEIEAIKHSQEIISKLDFEKLKLEYENRLLKEQEVTKRWESDNKSESFFNKNVRPMLVVYLVVVSTLLALGDGNIGEFKIEEHWVTLFTSLTLTAVGGYFALRTYEKGKGKHI
jgi:hypothetical protein